MACILSAALLSACTGSVLFNKKHKAVPPITEGSSENSSDQTLNPKQKKKKGQTSKDQNRAGNRARPKTDAYSPPPPYGQPMLFNLEADASLTETEPLEHLFGQQLKYLDPFELNNSNQQFEMRLRMRSVRVLEAEGENYVSAKLGIYFFRNGKVIMVRDFHDDGELLLKNIESSDFLSGAISDTEAKGTRLLIKGQRLHASTVESLKANPWRGQISLVRDNISYSLGTFKGFAE